jgi:hypothetical protein
LEHVREENFVENINWCVVYENINCSV